MTDNIYENLKKHLKDSKEKIKSLEDKIAVEKNAEILKALKEELETEKSNYEFYCKLKEKHFYIC